MTDPQTKFIDNQIFAQCRGAAFQRNKVYKGGISQKEKLKLMAFLKEKLLTYMKDWKKAKTITESAVLDQIKEISNEVSSEFGCILYAEPNKKPRFKLGTSQKLITLYMKYQWCLGRIKEPPLCPIDGIILKEIKDKTSWTKLDDINQYKKILKELKNNVRPKNKEGNVNLAIWELEFWNKISSKKTEINAE